MELRELLRPWHAVLRKTRLYDHDQDDGVLWFGLGNSQMHEGRVAFAIEGVQLFVWLALVSVDAFDAAVEELWPTTPASTAGVGATRQVAIFLSTQGNGYAAVSACFLTRTGKRRPSTEYLEARDAIQQQLQDLAASRPEILVHVLLGGPEPRQQRNVRRIVEYVRARTSLATTDADERWFDLRVAKVDFNRSEYYVVDDTRMSELNELLAAGVKIVNCRQPEFRTLRTPEATRETFRGIQRLLAARGSAAADYATACSGLDDLMLDPDHLAHEMAPLLFSALASSRSLRKLWIGITSYSFVMERFLGARKVMQWLGLAVFSMLAHHEIEVVELDFGTGAIESDVLHGILDVVVVDDPLAVVFDRHAVSIRANQHMRATASRFALADPAVVSTPGDAAVVDTYEHTGLRIITHENDWWSVLLPAWGQAWVHKGDIALTTSPWTYDSRTSTHRIAVLEASVDWCRIDALEAFVQHVGPAVETVKVVVGKVLGPGASTDPWSRAVPPVSRHPFQCELDVKRIQQSQLARFDSMIESLQLACSLVMVELVVSCEYSPLLTRFIGALSDPSQWTSRCLDALTLEFPVVTDPELDALSSQLVGMLCSNKRLESLLIRMRARGNEGSHRLEQALLAARTRTLLPSHLPIREKLAFLSVVWSNKNTTSHAGGAGIHDLDSAVITPILQFAAPPRFRQVSVDWVR